jgi:parallel beta-helix repeat protein
MVRGLTVSHRKIPSYIPLLCTLLLFSTINIASINPIKTCSATQTEVHREQSIQEAINDAQQGDTILVKAGIYHEHIVINKSISLIGENPATTILDGDGELYIPIVRISEPNVIASNFTVRNTATTTLQAASGILLSKAQNVTITNNIIKETGCGITLTNSSNCEILNNTIISSYAYGMNFYSESSNNIIISNLIKNNPNGVWTIEENCQSNTFYHNNFVNNTSQVQWIGTAGTHTLWDNGAEGNYWSDYTGEDLDGDGVGDMPYPYPTSPMDKCPLIEPWKPFRVYTVEELYNIIIQSNFTIASFNFSRSLNQTSFYITGPPDWLGFCNVTIPKALLNTSTEEKWLILIEDTDASQTANITENENRTSIYLPINADGLNLTTQKVRIRVVEKGQQNIPPYARFTYSPSKPTAYEIVHFYDESSDPDGNITERKWNFGDGNITHTNFTSVTHAYTAARTYTVTLTVTDDDNLTAFQQRPVIVQKLNSALSINVHPSTIIIGENATVNGALLPPKRTSVTIYYRVQGETHWQTLMTVMTNHNGIYQDVWEPQNPEAYELKAVWKGDETTFPANSSIVTLIVTKKKSSLTIDANPTSVTLGSNITITGNLTPKLEGTNITISSLRYSSLFTWTELATVKTDSNGHYAYNWTTTELGMYLLNASWPGDEQTSGIKSSTGSWVWVNKIPSNITINTEPATTTVNSNMTISGTITPPRTNANVTIQFRSSNETNSWNVTIQTDTNGNYQYIWTTSNSGTYQIKASWQGDANTKSAESETKTVTVEAEPTQPDAIYYAIAGVLIIAVLAALLYFKLRKR